MQAYCNYSSYIYGIFFQQCSQETYIGEQPFLWGLLPELLKGCVISQTFGFRESEQLVCYPYPGDDIIT